MKKIFTLIAAVMAVMSVNAQEWKVSAGDVAKGSTLLDNKYVTIKTGVQDSKAGQILDADSKPIIKKVGDFTFDYQFNIRVTEAPAEDNSWEGTAYTDCTPVGISLIAAPKANVDLTLYYGHGDGKVVSCYDVTAKEAIAIIETAADDGYKGVYKFQKDHSYVIYAKGGTTSLWGIDTAEGTYVAPSNKIYASESAAVVGDYSTITYGDGAQLQLLNSAKSWSNGSSITVDGQSYTSIKVSNGAQNKFIAPTGKAVTKVTFYSYVNKDAATTRPPYWKEVNGTAYDETTAKIMQSYKDGANPDVNAYDLPSVSEFTFTNAGEQVCFVMDVVYGEPVAINTVNADATAAKKTVKCIKNGQLVIETVNGTFNVVGARVK